MLRETLKKYTSPLLLLTRHLEFLIPGGSDTYIDIDLKLFIKGKLMKDDGTNLTDTDYTAGINKLLHSLFSQCSIVLNGMQITGQ